MRLHGYWRSSAAYRVRIALALKGCEAAVVTHDLRADEQRAPGYLNLNPQGLVPALESDDGAVLTQSLAILEWLEERYPAPPLLPQDAGDRAQVRAMVALIACDMHPLNNLRVLRYLRHQLGADQTAVSAWIGHWIAQGFAALEVLVARHSRGFAWGDAPSLADCCLVPQVYSAQRYAVDLAPYPRIVAVAGHCAGHPAFRAAHPLAQPDADPDG